MMVTVVLLIMAVHLIESLPLTPSPEQIQFNQLHFEAPDSRCEQLCGCLRFQSFDTCVRWFAPNVPCHPNQCFQVFGDPLSENDSGNERLSFEESTILEEGDLELFKQLAEKNDYSNTKGLGAQSETNVFIEGDILSVAENIEQLVNERNTEFVEAQNKRDENGEVQHAAQRDERYKWPNGLVPYRLYSNYTDEQRAILAGAMEHIESNSCVKFVPYEPSVHDYHLHIHDVGVGTCAAEVGRQWRNKGQGQAVMLGAWCFYAMGTVVHELMHSLGFFHEQSRADRDDHIEIQWDNLPGYATYNFRKYSLFEISHLGVPYDYDSIMHYGANYFGKYDALGQQKQTIRPLVKGVEIGQRKKLSVLDIEKLNRYLCQRAGDTVKEAEASPYVTDSSQKPEINEKKKSDDDGVAADQVQTLDVANIPLNLPTLQPLIDESLPSESESSGTDTPKKRLPKCQDQKPSNVQKVESRPRRNLQADFLQLADWRDLTDLVVPNADADELVDNDVEVEDCNDKEPLEVERIAVRPNDDEKTNDIQ